MKTRPMTLAGAYYVTRVPWGGVTLVRATGEAILAGSELYAVTVKPLSLATIRIPALSDLQTFLAAFAEAWETFKPYGDCLGIFHDADYETIDFDPTTVVKTQAEVDALFCGHPDFGGAYNFATGEAYYPAVR